MVNKSYSSGSAHSMDAEWFAIFALLHEIHCFCGRMELETKTDSPNRLHLRIQDVSERLWAACRVYSWLAQTDEQHREKNLYSRRTGHIRWHRGLRGFPRRKNRLSLTNGKWRAAQASSGSDALCTIVNYGTARNCTEPSILWN